MKVPDPPPSGGGYRATAHGANPVAGRATGNQSIQYRHRATVACTLTCWRLHLGCKVLGVRAGAAFEDVGEADLGSGRRGTEV